MLALSLAAIGAAMAFEVPSSTLLLSSRAPGLCQGRFTRPMAVKRAGVRAGRSGVVRGMTMTTVEEKTKQLVGAKAALKELIDQTNANPIMVRGGNAMARCRGGVESRLGGMSVKGRSYRSCEPLSSEVGCSPCNELLSY